MVRTCILVLGMHRSGTSALCGVLHQLGAERPLRELPPRPDNEKGFFEPSEIVAIHDRMLESAGLTWFDWEPLPDAWKVSLRRDAFIEELVAAASQDFPGCGPLLVKDPRVCRFVEVWLAVLERIQAKPKVILQYRHPTEVALSLKSRNGFPIGHTLLLWLRYVIDAERATRSVERNFVNYASLLEDWHGELAPTLADNQLSLARFSARAMAAAGDFLEPALRHQVKAKDTSRLRLHAWVEDAFEALEKLRDDPQDMTAMNKLDAVRDHFDGACRAFAPAFHQVSVRFAHLRKGLERLPQLESALAASQEIVAAWTPLVEQVPALQAEHENAMRALAAAQSEADRLQGMEATLAETLACLEALRAKSEQMQYLQAELHSARQRIVDLEREMADGLEVDRDPSTCGLPQSTPETAQIRTGAA